MKRQSIHQLYMIIHLPQMEQFGNDASTKFLKLVNRMESICNEMVAGYKQ